MQHYHKISTGKLTKSLLMDIINNVIENPFPILLQFRSADDFPLLTIDTKTVSLVNMLYNIGVKLGEGHNNIWLCCESEEELVSFIMKNSFQ